MMPTRPGYHRSNRLALYYVNKTSHAKPVYQESGETTVTVLSLDESKWIYTMYVKMVVRGHCQLLLRGNKYELWLLWLMGDDPSTSTHTPISCKISKKLPPCANKEAWNLTDSVTGADLQTMFFQITKSGTSHIFQDLDTSWSCDVAACMKQSFPN